MQYDGVSTGEANAYTRGFALLSSWNTNQNDAKYVGWMFGGVNGNASTSKEEAQRNETDSEIKTKVEEWYKTNIIDTGYSKYVADSIFCNDRSFESRNTGTGYGSSTTYYGARGRTGYSSGPTTPQFICLQENDKFTVDAKSGGNGALTYPVGLITADENLVAGSGQYGNMNTMYYLRKKTGYWSFSPGSLDSPYATVIVVGNSGGALHNYQLMDSRNVAPVINLKAEYLDKLQGDGTINNPYHLEV